MPELNWIIYNMMAIERDLLPEHLANEFVEFMNENRNNKLYQKCLEIALAILKRTTDEEILEEIYSDIN